mmetsp:Transcript_2208/g.2362  ORF Transcript_2208/g.2362 Transcript_2208/m.2362 type:complete len:95 (+) Transcript_2208:65-349(+)
MCCDVLRCVVSSDYQHEDKHTNTFLNRQFVHFCLRVSPDMAHGHGSMLFKLFVRCLKSSQVMPAWQMFCHRSFKLTHHCLPAEILVLTLFDKMA